jgi:hypothetical protein
MAPMDPSTSTPGPSSTVPPVGPWIPQLFPFPGNIYESASYYYDGPTDLNKGDFGAVIAFALAHCHPVTVHECHDLQEFQGAHPLAVVCPLAEIPPVLLDLGRFLLANPVVLSPAPLPFAPPMPVKVPRAQLVIALMRQALSLSMPSLLILVAETLLLCLWLL